MALTMLDFSPVDRRELSLAELAARHHITHADLIRLTEAMIEAQLALIADIEDADVVFQPVDPEAYDPYATDPEAVHAAWTLAHVIAHTTASSEECCAQAANLARGVPVTQRMRYEVPWQRLTTVAQLRHRLQESRRIRLAYLQAWPDEPHYDLTYTPYKTPHNCITRVLAGLHHDSGHLRQIAEIVRQAKAARMAPAEAASPT